MRVTPGLPPMAPPSATAQMPSLGPTGPSGPSGPSAGPPSTPMPAVPTAPPPRAPGAVPGAMNAALGILLGLVLGLGGLTLTLRFPANALDEDSFSYQVDWLNFTLTAVGALLIGAAFLLAVWSAWAPLLPGVIIAGLSVWVMVTNPLDGGFWQIHRAMSWLFPDYELSGFLGHGAALALGLAMIATSIAAMVLRSQLHRLAAAAMSR